MKKLFVVSFLVLVAVMAFWTREARGQRGGGCPTSAELFPKEAYEEAGWTSLQINNSGKIKVEVTYVSSRFFKNLQAMKDRSEGGRFATLEKYQNEGKSLLFAVGLTTMSLNLSDYRMEKISFLRDERGREYPAAGWEEGRSAMPSMPYHHRAGFLIFPKVDAAGNPIISDESKSIEIVIKDLAGVEERTFRWNLSPAE